MSTIYINKDTNGIIEAANIQLNDENNIIINKNNCWQLIPSNRIREEDTYNGYYPDNTVPKLNQYDIPDILAGSTGNETYTENIKQEFGFEKFEAFTRYPVESSGIISKPISMENTEYICFEAECENILYGSIEFSVLDGTNEIPILPLGSNIVTNEKLFYGIPLRFHPDQVQGKMALYKDDILTTEDYTLLSPEDLMDHNYYISYMAAGDTHTYTPVNDSIRLKIIIRQYRKEPVFINKIIIHKFGELPSWISAQSN